MMNIETRAANRRLITTKIERLLKLNAVVLSLSDLNEVIERDPFGAIEPGDVMLCVVFFRDQPAN